MKKKIITVMLLLSILMTFSITPIFASADIEKTQDLPNKAIVFFNAQDVSFDKNITELQKAGWQTVNKSSFKVTWKRGVTTAVVATAIAAGLALTPETVILGIGSGALAVLASSSIGGTVYVEEQVLNQSIGLPLRRYSIKIKDSEGKMHGPFYINMQRPRAVEKEMVEN